MTFSNTIGTGWLQASDYRDRIDRQLDWMPAEMLQPPPQITEDADVLPRIYKICLDAHLFRDYHTTLQERREDYAWILDRIISNVEAGRHCSDGILEGRRPPLEAGMRSLQRQRTVMHLTTFAGYPD
jgi:hypothetical protein